MKRLTLTLAAIVLILAPAAAGAQAPSTDIYLLPVNGLEVGSPHRLTDRDSYDNQPLFLPDGQRLVFSSMSANGTDITVYDLKTGVEQILHETAESEYSPTPIPGDQAISVVRDYGDLRQELWRFPLDGSEPEALITGEDAIGYHAWINPGQVLLFILGEPATLQRVDIEDGSREILARSPGRSLAAIPGSDEMSFVDKSADEWWIKALNPIDGTTRPLMATLPQSEDYAWAPDGSLWMAESGRLFRRAAGDSSWRQVADLESSGIYDITRLTFSADGQSLALAATRPPADLAEAYRQDAGRLLGAALVDQEGWEKLEYLAMNIGHRLSGSRNLEEAIQWAAQRMKEEGLAPTLQPVMVPHWVRGQESARMLAPMQRDLPMLGLGLSVGTPVEGITAPVVVVESFEELEALGRDKVEGRIVVYAVEWRGYGYTVQFRARGASRAAALGAVAILTRSATGSSLATPHTGALRYEDGIPRIPAAAITVEDANWIKHLARNGEEVVVNLKMEAAMLPDAQSHNVIAEIPGSRRPEEVVVMGCHYDSWDVGQGIHDDGAACIASWQALRIIQQSGLQPRRTLRVVLWTNEENGVRGGNGYRDDLNADELAGHVAAIEMDSGVERPVGFGFGLVGVDEAAQNPVYESARDRLLQIAGLTAAIDATEILRGGGGVDIGPLMQEGVPGLGLRTVGEHYFDWHHTHADTLDKVNKTDFRRAIALLGIMGYVLADMPERLVPAGEYGTARAGR